MYIEDFEQFYQQAEELFRVRPLETRYCIKYRHVDGKLVLKVTDDRTCLQYKTDQQADLKKLERLNNLFFALTAKGADAPSEGSMQIEQGTQQSGTQQTPSKKNRKKG